MTLPLKSYSWRCSYHYAELVKQGHDPTGDDFYKLLAQRMRLFGLMSEIVVDLTGRRVEVWRGTQEKVEL